MMRRLTWLLALWLGLVGSALAADDEVAFDDPVLNARYYSLTREIRCPLCLNESIAESKSDVAADLRREVKRMIGEGASDDEIKSALAARYGEFILYDPRLSRVQLLERLQRVVERHKVRALLPCDFVCFR